MRPSTDPPLERKKRRAPALACWTSLCVVSCAAADPGDASGQAPQGPLPVFDRTNDSVAGGASGDGAPARDGSNGGEPVGGSESSSNAAGSSAGGSSANESSSGPARNGTGAGDGAADASGDGSTGNATDVPPDGTSESDPDPVDEPPGTETPTDDAPADDDPAGDDDGFVSVNVSGGASAAFVCPTGPFGNPLAGLGAVQSVGAPQSSFFAFIEGPVWIGSRSTLFFSDNASGPERIWQISAPFTTPSVFMPDSGSNGLAVDNQDQLLVADQARDRIVRVNSESAQVLGEVGPSGGYNPNDLVLRSDDNLYFTDPNGPGRGFHRVSPSGRASGPFTQANAANAPNAPNGIALSPDENLLYVSDVNARFVSTYRLEADGAVDAGSGQVFANTQGGLSDGLAVDCAGNLYVSTQTGVEVFDPTGAPVGMVPTGEASNATFGGDDRRTLFVTSRAQLKFVTLGVPGLPD